MKKELEKYKLTSNLKNTIIDFCLKHPNLNSQMSWRSIKDTSYNHIIEGTFNTFCEALNFHKESFNITQENIIQNVIQMFSNKNNFEMKGNKTSQAQYMTFSYTTMTKEELEEMISEMYI